MAQRAVSVPPALSGLAYVRPLGTGGFADVFLYEQDMPRRVVAVKVLIADAINPEVRRQFNAEADAMARLSSHSSVLTIYQASIAGDGRPYLATEYCIDSMGERYKRGLVDLPAVLDTGVRIASALETAHRVGVLHRDIKPSNILITTLGRPVLSDFGIAMSLAAGGENRDVVAMSVPWSSPEVLAEATTGTVASEIWSLGATLYTLLAGRSPFALPDRTKNRREFLTARIMKAQYVPISRSDVPAPVEDFLARCMSRDPAKRPASMLAAAEELRWIQHQLGLVPTALEVAPLEWARASSVNLNDDAYRGPVVTTVNQNSRRAVRAERQARPGEEIVPDSVVAPRSKAPLIWTVAIASVVAAAGVTVGALMATGVL